MYIYNRCNDGFLSACAKTLKSVVMCVVLMGLGIVPAMGQSVEQKLDSLQILIGEQTTLHLKVVAKQGQKIAMPTFQPSQELTPGVEVVEQTAGDTTQLGDNGIQVSRDYILTSFDDKVYAIPALKVKVDGKEYQGNQLALKVLTVPVDTVHPNQFYPPKGVQDNPFLWSEWSHIFWLSVLILLLCVAICYLTLRLKQNKPIITHIRIVKKVPAHEKALSEINVIKQQRADNKESQKEYYTQLTNTLREYIVSRFGFNAMEMTSSEIIDRLQSAGDPKMIYELRELFQTADLVKFAKYETLINENDANLVNAINFIDQTKTNEVVQEEKVAPELSAEDKKSQSQRKLIKSLLWIGGIAIIGILAYIVYQVWMLLM